MSMCMCVCVYADNKRFVFDKQPTQTKRAVSGGSSSIRATEAMRVRRYITSRPLYMLSYAIATEFQSFSICRPI